jgi:hypothetical protein
MRRRSRYYWNWKGPTSTSFWRPSLSSVGDLVQNLIYKIMEECTKRKIYIISNWRQMMRSSMSIYNKDHIVWSRIPLDYDLFNIFVDHIIKNHPDGSIWLYRKDIIGTTFLKRYSHWKRKGSGLPLTLEMRTKTSIACWAHMRIYIHIQSIGTFSCWERMKLKAETCW